MRKSLLWKEVLFHLVKEKSIAGLSETEANQRKDLSLHKVEPMKSCHTASSETNSFDKKRPRQFSE